MAEYETYQHDVLVIGAGGAGLRAAIEASAAGVSVGLVCKSLLGKAHTVMAEGGIAAALANVDDRDNWQVHFADTMRGGQYVKQSAEKCPQRGCDPFAPPASQRSRQHIENSRPRRDRQYDRRPQKQQKMMRVRHPKILSVPRVSGKPQAIVLRATYRQ